jgi:hypothetical protein
MKKKNLYMAGVVICVSALLLSCSSEEYDDSGQEWEERFRNLETTFMNRYHPVRFPPPDFARRKVFTHNVQKLLVNENGKPVLFDGFLDDITKDGDQFFVHFTSRLSNDASYNRTVRFHLRCGYGDVQSLLEEPPEYRDVSKYLFLKGVQKDFLVVAQITDAKKIVNYTVLATSSEGTEQVDLEIRSPDTFSVNGELLEMVKYSKISR